MTEASSGAPHGGTVPDLSRLVRGSRLTLRQVRFALLLAESASIADAGRSAGYAESSVSKLFHLCRRPEIRAIAYERRRQIAEGLAVKSEAVIALLWNIASKKKGDDRAKVAACSTLLQYLDAPARVSAKVLDEHTEQAGAPDHADMMLLAAAVGVPMDAVVSDDGETEGA